VILAARTRGPGPRELDHWRAWALAIRASVLPNCRLMKSRAHLLTVSALITALSTALSCKPEEEPETHGFVCVEVRPGVSAQSDVAALFAGTKQVKITVNYLECLKDFYLNTHTEYALVGVEGEAVFEEWRERLCSEPINGRVDCEVADYRQDLSTSLNLTVTYDVSDPNALEGRKFLVGPLPLEEFANCKPDVKVAGSNAAVSGYDANNALLWKIEAFNAITQGRASLRGGGCIPVDVGR